jgi:dimethylhistidine N-methyltransferase
MTQAAVRLVDHAPETIQFRDDVWAGLARRPKSISPKYFYDAKGSALFERICALPEYYPTRTEQRILDDNAAEIAALIGPGAHVVEYGSGGSDKVRTVLGALVEPVAYTAVDISGDPLQGAIGNLAKEYKSLEVTGVVADYMHPVILPRPKRTPHTLVTMFMGSTIGNFATEEAMRFLTTMARQLIARGGGTMLIGADLQKDEATLHAAYNDSAGVTAAFNLNLLDRINRELGGNFERAAYNHVAFYNASEGRIEMHIEAKRAQSVTIEGRTFRLDAGERIHTENSYKFTVNGFRSLARMAGFFPERVWLDKNRLFSVHLLRVR